MTARVIPLFRESRSSRGSGIEPRSDRHGEVVSLCLATVDWCEWFEHRPDDPRGCGQPVVARWHRGDRAYRACCELCLRASP